MTKIGNYVAEHTLREFPAQEKRVETGAIRFGDDWPGMFIRGDNSIIAGAHLDACCHVLESGHTLPPFEVKKLRNLAMMLQDCDAKYFFNSGSDDPEPSGVIPSQGR